MDFLLCLALANEDARRLLTRVMIILGGALASFAIYAAVILIITFR